MILVMFFLTFIRFFITVYIYECQYRIEKVKQLKVINLIFTFFTCPAQDITCNIITSQTFFSIAENAKHIKTRSEAPRLCPYLDTINRQFLDFDFEKLCSVSLSRINVYACLVCGKYFQGRGTNTHAYTHSVAESHHVFLNLHTLKFYCLPDNYEIVGK